MEGGIAKVESGSGDEEVTGDEGVESGDKLGEETGEEVTGDEGGEPGDMLGEETGEDGGCKSTRCEEEVEQRGTVSAGVISESGKVRKEISCTEKVEEDGRGQKGRDSSKVTSREIRIRRPTGSQQR